MKAFMALVGAVVILFAIAALLGRADALQDNAADRARKAGW